MLESLLNKTAAFKASDFIEKHSTTGVFVRILRNFWEQLFLIPPNVHYTSHFKFYVVINSLDVLGYKIDFEILMYKLLYFYHIRQCRYHEFWICLLQKHYTWGTSDVLFSWNPLNHGMS